jgi:hypothetical protein
MPRPGTVVVLYHRPSHLFFKDAATVREHIHSFKRFSRFPVWEVNTDLGFPPGLGDVEPGAVILHYSLFGSGIYQLDERFLDWLRRRNGMVKVAFFQDEFYFCRRRFAFVNDFGVDLVFTHVSPAYMPQVWGRYAPGVRAVFNLPGYVDDGLLAAARRFARPDAERDIDVSYRGRPLPRHMGAGSQEKRVIGDRFKELAEATTLRVDIETAEESRLYGAAWYRLLGRSRATLGVESGVSFMDLEDECHDEYARYRSEGREPTVEELDAGALGRWDGNIPYRTLGPRHFEAAAFRICQVLFEGEYSGAIEPMVHYVPLKKDFSNFAEVVAVIQDAERRRRITERAYDDLIASGRFGYAGLIETVDRELVDTGLSLERPARERKELHAALRRGHVRRSVRRRVVVTLELAVAKLRHTIWRVVAPVSLRVRRILGLPAPT